MDGNIQRVMIDRNGSAVVGLAGSAFERWFGPDDIVNSLERSAHRYVELTCWRMCGWAIVHGMRKTKNQLFQVDSLAAVVMPSFRRLYLLLAMSQPIL